MAIIGISEAAKLVGRDRSTIHRYIRHGKLSKLGDGVDTSELIRVFGSISDATLATSATVADATLCNTVPHQEQAAVLEKEVELLRQQLAREQSFTADLQRRLDQSEAERRSTQERLTALLTHQPAAESNPVTVADVKTPDQAAAPDEMGLMRTWLKKIW